MVSLDAVRPDDSVVINEPEARRDPAELTARLGVAAGAIVVILARLWTSWGRAAFHMTPDEPGQIAISRFIGGGNAHWNMYDHSTWRPGYGTLISPIWWFTDDPTTVFKTAITVNALLGGLAFVLLFDLARRLTAMSHLMCILSALAVCLSPMVLFTTDWVWSEALVSVLYLAAIWTLLRFEDSPTISRGLAAAALAIAGYGTHSRLLPLAIVVVGMVALNVYRKRIAVPNAAVVIGGLALFYVAMSWYSEFIVDRLWEQPLARNSYGGVKDQLLKVGSTMASVVGQLWYQLVVTAGIFGIGVIALVGAARRRAPKTDDAPTAADARVVLAAVGSLMALSMVFMADRWRPDQVVYGRYSDAVVGPVLLVGIGWLVARHSVRQIVIRYSAIGASVLLLGVVLNALRHDELSEGVGVRSMILGLQSFIGKTKSIKVVWITLVALAFLAAIAAAALLGSTLGRHGIVLVVVFALITFGYGRTRDIADGGKNVWAGGRAVREVVDDDIVPDGSVVRYRLVSDSEQPDANRSRQRQRFMLYQFYLPELRFEIDDGGPEDVSPFVFAPTNTQSLIDEGGTIVWRDPSAGIGLWELPERPG